MYPSDETLILYREYVQYTVNTVYSQSREMSCDALNVVVLEDRVLL